MKYQTIVKSIFLLIVLSLASGCGGKLTKKRTANVAFFADTSIALVGDTNFGLTRDDAVYNRDLFSPGEEEEQRLNAKLLEINEYLKVIVRYSLKIVDIAETGGSEQNIVALYADTLAEASDWVENNLELESTRYDEIVESVRAQETFLAALREAQPVINAYGRYAEILIEELDTATEAVVLKIDGRIDEKFADVVSYQAALRAERSAILGALSELYKTYRGDSGAYEQLRTSDAIVDRTIAPDVDSPTQEQLNAIAHHLRTRLDGLSLIEDQIQREWEDYRESHRELDRKHADLEAQRNRARLVFLVWIRAHRNMASGKMDPAEWFDISAVPGTLFRTGTSIIF